jgi:hypothetical protein
MVWVFKKDYQLNSVDDFIEHENNIVIYPNPASNQLFIESKARLEQEFRIINLLGKKVASGRINGRN